MWNPAAVQFKAIEKELAEVSRLTDIVANEALEPILEDLMAAESKVIADKLRDKEPMVRRLAILVAERRWLPVEKELIDLLSDPFTPIRTAAQQALVRLSRGNNFGPKANATPAQAAQAMRDWQRWLKVQDRTDLR
jgi:hypothetical protein